MMRRTRAFQQRNPGWINVLVQDCVSFFSIPRSRSDHTGRTLAHGAGFQVPKPPLRRTRFDVLVEEIWSETVIRKTAQLKQKSEPPPNAG
jgi:hypothetical protein